MNIKEIYESGKVKRYHTAQTLKEQNNAAHSWGVATIVLWLCPEASANLLKAALLHDTAELFTGDVPAPVKWKHEDIAAALDAAEFEALARMGISTLFTDLTHEEMQYLKFADMAELVLFAANEIRIGNATMIDIYRRGCEYLKSIAVLESMRRFITHMEIH